ncbi:MAG: helix-turn-helix transcriptional regulator [Erysipelotrichaceae bacterium]|nr:helix-turn-helix transcriptional regulator [Erysipelotrichaceae bacterium]
MIKDKKGKTLAIDHESLEKELKKNNPLLAKDFDEIDEYVKLISPLIVKRNKLGLSQRELAKLCDLPQSTIGRIETSATVASVTSLIKITKALGLSITIR